MNKKVKKLLLMTSTLGMLSFAMVGCGNNDSTDTTTEATSEDNSQTSDNSQSDFIETNISISVEEQDGIPAHEIPATLTIPANTEEKLPAVVMLHGTGSWRDEAGDGYKIAAGNFAKAGIVSLRIDFMGSGDSTASDTDYCPTSANIDAKAAADYLAKLDIVNSDAIGVLGWSQGGMNALLAASQYPETFKTVVTWSSSIGKNPEEEPFKSEYETAKKDGYTVTEFDWREPMKTGLRWYEEVANLNVLEQVEAYPGPILAIHGLKDDVVPVETSEKIVEASANDKTTSYFIEDCDHTYNVFSGDLTALNDAINATANYFNENLK